MGEPAYPAARAVALRIHDYFRRHLAAARDGGAARTPPADVAALEAIIDAAFWASLRREEGYAPKISLACLPLDERTRPLVFGRPLPLEPAVLARLAPAVERPGIHLGVWRGPDGLGVWGTTRVLPAPCPVVEVVAPGLLVVKHRRREEADKFVNVAVLEGDQVKVLDQRVASHPEYPALVASLLGFDAFASVPGSINVLVRLAVSMRAHGRGGSLLVVPAGSDTWRESIVHPIAYGVLPAFTELSDLMATESGTGRSHSWHEALEGAVDAIAGLTAIDGATVITDRYELLAFGAKIVRRRGCAQVERVRTSEPIEDGVAAVVPPAALGGTRHMSAAQFVQDQRAGVALVASQDGRFTAFSWGAVDETVQAFRVEALLL